MQLFDLDVIVLKKQKDIREVDKVKGTYFY